MPPRPLLAVTMGDPAGVGPELCVRLLAHEPTLAVATPVVFGDFRVLRAVADRLGLPLPVRVVSLADVVTVDGPAVVNFDAVSPADFTPGTVNAACGAAAYRYFTAAVDAALAKRVAGVVTAPLNKESLAAAGVPFPGHTEILASRTNAERACMVLTAPEITCALVTAHVGYRDVPGLLTVEGITNAIELTADAMRRIRGWEPRLVVCGLNPHAGEHGLFGAREEERIIVPAIEMMRAKGYQLDGPLPPDTAFLAGRRKATDAYVCMYHDQGLIPLKALAFDDAVNVTLGLPIVRTSVDHGTAFDIAWQGTANPNSLYEAVRLAVKLCGA